MPHAVLVADEWELALARVREALDRVIAAWAADHPDHPIPTEPPPPAWHPDPTQHPVTTRQWAEVTRMRAAQLCQHGVQALEHAKQVHQATQRLHAFLHRPSQDHQGEFTRVSPAILLPRRRDIP